LRSSSVCAASDWTNKATRVGLGQATIIKKQMGKSSRRRTKDMLAPVFKPIATPEDVQALIAIVPSGF
jgi:hypothetical protein